MREASIEKSFGKYVDDLGGWAIKLVPAFISGLPDRLVLLPGGRAIFVELKKQGKTARGLQSFLHRKLRALGFTVIVIDNTQDFKQITL